MQRERTLMRKILMLLLFFYFVIGTTGCATITQPPNSVVARRNPYNIFPFYSYKDYEIEIISDPPGAKIEWNNEYLGEAPLEQVLTGDMGSLTSIMVIANPVYPGQYVQHKLFTGDKPIPKRIYFNMSLIPTGNDINVNINQ